MGCVTVSEGWRVTDMSVMFPSNLIQVASTLCPYPPQSDSHMKLLFCPGSSREGVNLALDVGARGE
eukprot:876386-Amorphochlora_amoeboformis.AAC.3